jgi:GNAT superfamily N-acetyltransferase
MTGTGIPIPELDPPWPSDRTIAIVSSDGSPLGWRTLAHQVVAVFQAGGHSFPLAEPVSDSRGGSRRKAFLYRWAGQVCGCLVLADKAVTGYREASARYREAAAAERVIRPCVLTVWVAPEVRRRGVARQLVAAAAQHSRVTVSSLSWAEPFTDSGYLLARSVTPDGMWIADYT